MRKQNGERRNAAEKEHEDEGIEWAREKGRGREQGKRKARRKTHTLRKLATNKQYNQRIIVIVEHLWR